MIADLSSCVEENEEAVALWIGSRDLAQARDVLPGVWNVTLDLDLHNGVEVLDRDGFEPCLYVTFTLAVLDFSGRIQPSRLGLISEDSHIHPLGTSQNRVVAVQARSNLDLRVDMKSGANAKGTESCPYLTEDVSLRDRQTRIHELPSLASSCIVRSDLLQNLLDCVRIFVHRVTSSLHSD